MPLSLVRAFRNLAVTDSRISDDRPIGNPDNFVIGNGGAISNGGAGGSSADGGDGLGGGIFLFARPDTTAAVSLVNTDVELNSALGGPAGSGGSTGRGIGGGVYNDGGPFMVDALTVIAHNHASTSNHDRFGC